jgi:Fic family protein
VEQGERPGEFKKHDYVTGIAEVGSLPEDVEKDLTELLEELADYEGRDVLKAAAYFHARFEYIHPFADGNGRVGRTLLNYWLMTRGHPPVIVHDEDKRAYYGALSRYDEAEDGTDDSVSQTADGTNVGKSSGTGTAALQLMLPLPDDILVNAHLHNSRIVG